MSWVRGCWATTDVRAVFQPVAHKRTQWVPFAGPGTVSDVVACNMPTTCPGNTPSKTRSMTPFPESAGSSKGLSCKDQEEARGRHAWASPWRQPERQAASARSHLLFLGACCPVVRTPPRFLGARSATALWGHHLGADPRSRVPSWGAEPQRLSQTVPGCQPAETVRPLWAGLFWRDGEPRGGGSVACSPSGMLC